MKGGIAPSTILHPRAKCPMANTHSISQSGSGPETLQTPLSISPLSGSIYLKHFKKQHSLNIFGLEMSPEVLPKPGWLVRHSIQYRKEPGLRRQEPQYSQADPGSSSA